ncbi:helix-turn-helix domain-containing protein [Azospirillum brasilense]|nr:helix-turn-helix domain-containing protein [Azospirillum brasilense]NUB35163.1 helix-turn-helix domain-containing protein [Azospirillum brasilense]RIW07703.1 DNA-binding protein [Azospirillum brasilense]
MNNPGAERIRADRVAAITGLSKRSVQLLAKQGKIPSAAQLVEGGAWTFVESEVRRWVKLREDATTCLSSQRLPTTGTYTKSTGLGTSGSRSTASQYEKVYEQRIKRKRSPAATVA